MKKTIRTTDTEFQKKVRLLPIFEDCSVLLAKASRDITEEDAIAYIDKRVKEIESKE